jgi:hypothetical protein
MSKIRGLAEVLAKIDECLQIQRVAAMIQPLPNRNSNRYSCAASRRPCVFWSPRLFRKP